MCIRDSQQASQGSMSSAYISGATITVKDPDTNEIITSTTTDEYGKYSLVYQTYINYVIIESRGGINIATNKPFKGVFKTIKLVNLELGERDIITSEETNLNALTTLATSVTQKNIANNSSITPESALTSAKSTVATTLGISADTIDEDYLKVKNPASLAAAAQISSVLTVVSSSTGGTDDVSSNEAALDSFAELLTTSSETVNLSSTDNLKTIIETAAVSTGTSIAVSYTHLTLPTIYSV